MDRTEEHSIGKTIAELRKSKGWTQAELAEKLQVSDKAVSKWELGNGAPSLEFFPAIAELFGVSIDYLMTGKAPEKEVVTISKAELCAQSDDPAMLEGLDPAHRDEQGRSLVDHILQYRSFRVFEKFCELKKGNIAHFTLQDAIKMSILCNRLDLLRGASFHLRGTRDEWTFESERDLLELFPAEERTHVDPNFAPLCVLPDDLFETIVSDPRVEPQTREILFGKQVGRECVWYQVFPYLIHESYRLELQDVLRQLLSLSETNNACAYGDPNINKSRREGYFLPYGREWRDMWGGSVRLSLAATKAARGYGIVRILEKTIKLALERGDFENFETFQSFNERLNKTFAGAGYLATEYEVRMAKLKADKSVTQEELTIQSTVHDGLLNLDELLATKNLPLIQKALAAYDIHPIEPLCRMFQGKQWKALFEYAVDHKNDTFAQAVIRNDEKTMEQEIAALFLKSVNGRGYPSVGKKELALRGAAKFPTDRSGSAGKDLKVAAIAEYLEAYRKQIIFDLAYEEEKIKTIEELTKEFFEAELEKGNTEIVIVKLCVRLEAILRSSYQYEGDFSKMLDTYCSHYGTEVIRAADDDDYDRYEEREFVKYLQKLRMCRNSIVHAEKKIDMLTPEEIRYCVDYICKMK